MSPRIMWRISTCSCSMIKTNIKNIGFVWGWKVERHSSRGQVYVMSYLARHVVLSPYHPTPSISVRGKCMIKTFTLLSVCKMRPWSNQLLNVSLPPTHIISPIFWTLTCIYPSQLVLFKRTCKYIYKKLRINRIIKHCNHGRKLFYCKSLS